MQAEPELAGIPIVFCPHGARCADLSRGEELGVQRYMIEPIELTELVTAIVGTSS